MAIADAKATMGSRTGAAHVHEQHLRAVRFWLGIFMTGLVLSGVTAFPLETELRFFLGFLEGDSLRSFGEWSHLLPWIARVYEALAVTNRLIHFWLMAPTGWPLLIW